MASGHEYRANRPNTWLLRPLLQSEDSSCQPGAVHTWPFCDIKRDSEKVRLFGWAEVRGRRPKRRFWPSSDLARCSLLCCGWAKRPTRLY